MKATLILRHKEHHPDGGMMELVVWQVDWT